jgi:hypothetical protein
MRPRPQPPPTALWESQAEPPYSPGKGRWWRDPTTGSVSRVVDGWICGTAAGGFSCGKRATHSGGPSLNAVARAVAGTARGKGSAQFGIDIGKDTNAVRARRST